MSESLLIQTNLTSSTAAGRNKHSQYWEGEISEFALLIWTLHLHQSATSSPLDMTRWNISLILSSGKKDYIPPSSSAHTIDFKDVRMSLDALIPLWLPAASSAEAIET